MLIIIIISIYIFNKNSNISPIKCIFFFYMDSFLYQLKNNINNEKVIKK